MNQLFGTQLSSSMWFVYTVMIINVIIIWFMPKRLTRNEIYGTWLTVVAINLSTDILFALYFKFYYFYQLGGVHLSVHIIEWTLGPSNAILYLNFMPSQTRSFMIYVIVWVAYSLLFEALALHFHFLNYLHWHLWISGIYYLLVFLFLRWHLWFIRKK